MCCYSNQPEGHRQKFFLHAIFGVALELIVEMGSEFVQLFAVTLEFRTTQACLFSEIFRISGNELK